MSVTGLPPIPAMTTDAEREAYYRLVRQYAGEGAVVELGAWIGASTAYIAAALRDAGNGGKVDVYDNFALAPDHARKVSQFYQRQGLEDVALTSCLDAFRRGLGPLLDHVRVHQGDIADIEWTGSPISVLICDAPKDTPHISSVLTTFGKSIGRGAIMAWQDFYHFQSYAIPACLYRLRRHVEVVEAVAPGSTLIFRIVTPFDAADVSPERLALETWTADEIDEAWDYWSVHAPADRRALFMSGAAMFQFDCGYIRPASVRLKDLCERHYDDIAPRWQLLNQTHRDLAKRYWPLIALLDRYAPA